MTQSPKITVIVPIYNVAGYLEKCLSSLTSQTIKNISIVCVNDGSTDNSLEILEKYAKAEPRIKIIDKKNGGLSSARNAALKNVSTEFVMFCDSDDYFEPNMCERMLNAIETDNSDLAACAQRVIYQTHEEMHESDSNYYRLKYTGKTPITDEVTLDTDVSVLNKIFRMKVIKNNHIMFPEGLNNEDFYFYNAYMSVSSSITFVNQDLYNYIRRENSIMSENFDAKTLSMDHLLVAEKLFDFYRKTGFLKDHTDLFWEQWVLSFWFAIEHSSKNTHKQIYAHAKDFANKNLESFLPQSSKTKRDVKYIQTNSFFTKLKRKTHHVATGVYKKINIKYRQQNYINSELESLLKATNELSDRLEKLKEE